MNAPTDDLTAQPKRLALRCSPQEADFFAQAVTHLGTSLSVWMRAVVINVVEESKDVERRLALQARLALYHGTARAFGAASKVLNARAPEPLIADFLAAVGEQNLSMGLRWAMYEAAQVSFSMPSHVERVEAYNKLQRQAFSTKPKPGPQVEALDDLEEA